ncbi:hypothetical protein EGX74_22715 (plasmid) [Yersinia pestis]|nr:hypothetical protein EGX74_22715 [Yersinia pestis]
MKDEVFAARDSTIQYSEEAKTAADTAAREAATKTSDQLLSAVNQRRKRQTVLAQVLKVLPMTPSDLETKLRK